MSEREEFVYVRMPRRAWEHCEKLLGHASLSEALGAEEVDARDILSELFPSHGMLPDGKEAEELRTVWAGFVERIEALEPSDEVLDEVHATERVIDDVIDARDSLAYLELKEFRALQAEKGSSDD